VSVRPFIGPELEQLKEWLGVRLSPARPCVLSSATVLISGDYGSGKTLLVRTVAKEMNVALIELNAVDLMGKYVAEGEAVVRPRFNNVFTNMF
jgi:AAA+ superfamily predicted ATPase